MILVEVSDATKANTSMQMQASDPMPCTNPLTELKAAESAAGLVPGSICGGGCLFWSMQNAIDAVSMTSVGQMLCLAVACRGDTHPLPWQNHHKQFHLKFL